MTLTTVSGILFEMCSAGYSGAQALVFRSMPHVLCRLPTSKLFKPLRDIYIYLRTHRLPGFFFADIHDLNHSDISYK